MPYGVYPVPTLHPKDGNRSPTLALRARSWLRRRRHDDRLAHGADPASDRALALRADRICSGTRAKQAAAHARVVRIARSSPEGVSDPAALLATLYQGYARVFAVQSAQLRRLGPPPAPAGPMVQFLTRSDEVVALLRQAAAAAGSGNLADSQGFEQNARGIAAQALQAAQLYGLKACGRFGLS